MKKSIISKTLLLVLALSTIGASVGIGLNVSKSEIDVPVTFVASDNSGYNTEVKIGNYNYKFKGSIDQKSNKFTLNGTVVGRATSSGGFPGGGFPGGGFPGGGFPGGGFPGGGSSGGAPGGGETTKVAVESVSLTLDKTQAFIGETVKATASILPENATTKDVEWKSSDEKIATVSSGTITPLAEGEVVITATSKDDKTKSASATLKIVKEDYTPYEYTLNGTYTIDDGYGYVFSFQDENKTTIHCDYNKVEGRHEFYYTVNTPAGSGFVKFQAKDINFKSKLAKDYKTWDVRDSKYIFTSLATGNNSSVAYAYMYLHSDGSVNINTPSGVNRVVESENLSWSEDSNKNITVKKGDTVYKADKTINPDRPGYKIQYGSYVFINSQNPDVKWKKLGIADFEGAPKAEFAGRYEISGPGGGSGNLSMQLFDGGVAKLYKNTWNKEAEGTWTENNGEYTIVIGEKTYTSVTTDGEKTITYTVSAKTPWGSDASTDVVLALVK